MPVTKGCKVLEIGCGEGGNMLPFFEIGCDVTGVDLNQAQIERARIFLKDAFPSNEASVLYQDIYEVDLKVMGQFDLIILRDVIEHIHHQEKFMHFVKLLMKPNGKIFFGFPPWHMPFGGHQQVIRNKVFSHLPYFHILPKPIYRGMLKLASVDEKSMEDLLEIKDTGISINRFERIVKQENFIVYKKDIFLINPNYETKFGLKPRKLAGIFAYIPHVRDFISTCYYCVLGVPS